MSEGLSVKPRNSPCNGLDVQREDNQELTQGLAVGTVTQRELRKYLKPIPLSDIIFYRISHFIVEGSFFRGRPCHFKLCELRGECRAL